MSGNDFVIQDGTRLRTGTSANQTFGGATLTLEAGGEMALKAGDLKTKVPGTVSFASLIGDGGAIYHAVANTQTINGGTVSMNADKSLIVGLSPNNRTLIIASELIGGDSTQLAITSSFESGSEGQVLELQNAAGFSGTITGSKSNADATGTFALKLTGGFSGTITSLPSDTTQVLVNYDGLPSGKGLRVATTTIPELLKTTLVLYSDTKSTLKAGDVVMTFPVGTKVDPSEFKVGFAYGVSGAVATLPLEVNENGDDTISLVVKNDSGSTYVWTGAAGDGKMSTGGNWDGGVAPGAGAALDFSGVTEGTTIVANGLTSGDVMMGTGVITFTGSFTAKSFTDTSKIAVGANSTVTLDGDLIISNTVSRYILASIEDGGRFVVNGVIEHTSSATAELKPFSGNGAIVAKGLVSNAKNGTGTGYNNIYLFRLTRPSNYTSNWIIGSDGLSGSLRFWCFKKSGSGSYTATANIQPDDSDFSIATTIGADGTLNLNTTGADGKAHKITFSGNGSINQGGAVNIKGAGTVELGNPINGNNTVNVEDGATLVLKRGTNAGRGVLTVKSGATLDIGESAATKDADSVTLNGNLTLQAGATLAFNYTNRNAPKLAIASGKSVTASGAVKVKITAAEGVRPKSGENVLTSCGGFAGVNVSLAEGCPDWALGVEVNEDGNIVLDVKPAGLMVIIR